MEAEVKNDYIEKALSELVSVFGTKEPIDHQKIISLVRSKKINEAIKKIALYLGLPIEVNISYVPEGYQPSNNDGFQSTHIVKTDWRGRGTSGITAQVSIPPNLPLYGTSRMVNFPINVRLSENYAENPATLIAVMAHEFSHIVLYSILHQEKENEYYTDLTAMLLGFATTMRVGRKVTKKIGTSTTPGILAGSTTTYMRTTTYGYLSDENFNFAFNKIKTILNEQKIAKKKLIQKLDQSQKQLAKIKKLSSYFEKYLEYLDKNLNRKISKEDGYKISVFHQPGYTDNFQFVIRKKELISDNFLKFLENLKTYTPGSLKTIEEYETRLKLTNEELAKQHLLLRKDVDVLKEYVNFFYKLKLRLKFSF